MEAGKIIEVCIPFVGDTIGGSHISALTLIKHLDPDVYNIRIVAHQKGKLTDYMDRNGIQYKLLELSTYVGRQRNPFMQLISIFRVTPMLFKYLRLNSINIVHTHDARMHLTWATCSKLAKTTHIWHQRTTWAKSRIGNLMVKLVSHVVAISDLVKRTLPKNISSESTVIFNPVDVAVSFGSVKKLRQKVLRDAGIMGDCKIVIFVGNLRKVKEPMLFMQTAFQMIERNRYKLIFLVLGEDREGYVKRMQLLALEKGYMKNFLFYGFRENVLDFVAFADLLIATSSNDAFGRTLIEAMALKVPVVATSQGGHVEIIEDEVSGRLSFDSNSTQLAQLSSDLLEDDKKRNFIIQNAYERSKALYGPAQHAALVSSIYRRFIT